jgi:intracellular septation protein A
MQPFATTTVFLFTIKFKQMSRQTWMIVIAVAVVIGIIYMYEKKLSAAKETLTVAATGGTTTSGGTNPTPEAGENATSRLNTQY